eukprot:NODE_552_length_1554_cov_100.939535_g415_i0.p1 GENE.NODE_552_length_1554_cov_100.939535_g415_i0~~NODE_552_length_1554_cov_100.939535_g415_i0.p1  ORF type:complete len:408 (-),score=104.37 NODE_552_length_1554_cov_100.939535_g415_i0:266-1489(-)
MTSFATASPHFPPPQYSPTAAQPPTTRMPPNAVPAFIFPAEGGESSSKQKKKKKKKKKKSHHKHKSRHPSPPAEPRHTHSGSSHKHRRRTHDSSSSDSESSFSDVQQRPQRTPHTHSPYSHEYFQEEDHRHHTTTTSSELVLTPGKRFVKETAMKKIKQPIQVSVPTEKVRMKQRWVREVVPERYVVDEVQTVVRELEVPTTVFRMVDDNEGRPQERRNDGRPDPSRLTEWDNSEAAAAPHHRYPTAPYRHSSGHTHHPQQQPDGNNGYPSAASFPQYNNTALSGTAPSISGGQWNGTGNQRHPEWATPNEGGGGNGDSQFLRHHHHYPTTGTTNGTIGMTERRTEDGGGGVGGGGSIPRESVLSRVTIQRSYSDRRYPEADQQESFERTSYIENPSANRRTGSYWS